MTGVSLDAAAILADRGVQARVLDMVSVKPIDRAAVIAAARETGAVVTAEEHLVRGGLGAAVAQVVAETHPVPMRFIGINDTYLESGSVEELMARHHLTAEDIVKAAENVIRAKGQGINAARSDRTHAARSGRTNAARSGRR
jgi:transketolase